ncbi:MULTISPECIES: DUF2500 domain-containing protein [unclassified Bacillus (in: firmicutes)]|uniref:DUF2500 domain-containing protein n=1 Tax=unclassified Bacillus (in: firmicutes) TaxID=185979 RepID=UPI0004E2389D|nr:MULTISPECIES: DUF2500 domain-containing protein [unclassified Bacillus (in: firmicutes)]
MGNFFAFEDFIASGDILFAIVPLFILTITVIIFVIIVVRIVKGLVKWSKNNNQPRLSTPAKVVAKRTSVHGGGNTRAYNHYYVTFEFPSGERTEFQVNGGQFGMLIEGDNGELQCQGTRYLGFTRNEPIGEQTQ